MKKNYEKPFFEIHLFDLEDIVTESPGINAGAEGNEDDIFNGLSWNA